MADPGAARAANLSSTTASVFRFLEGVAVGICTRLHAQVTVPYIISCLLAHRSYTVFAGTSTHKLALVRANVVFGLPQGEGFTPDVLADALERIPVV